MNRVNDAWVEFTVYPASLHAAKEKPDRTVASIALHRGWGKHRNFQILLFDAA